jgi:hypothetical protein
MGCADKMQGRARGTSHRKSRPARSALRKQLLVTGPGRNEYKVQQATPVPSSRSNPEHRHPGVLERKEKHK